MSRKKIISLILWLTVYLCNVSIPLFAQDVPSDAQPVRDNQDVVTYPASFFSRYRPDSALDMLVQLPGFIMAVSGELRGYGSSPGNVLIDGRRPSSKRVTVPSILDRIPASHVDRIELIRSPVRDIEMLGEPEVANVIMKTDVPAAVRWSFVGYDNFDVPPMPWFSNVSLSDRWNSIDYNAGLDIFRVVYSETNDEDIFDGAGNLTEERFEEGYDKEFEGNFDLSASTSVGDTLLTWASQIGIQYGGEDFVSNRMPLIPGEEGTSEISDGDSDEFQFEVGMTAERNLAQDLSGNFLVFFKREDEHSTTNLRVVDSGGSEISLRQREINQLEKEAIVRSEFEWIGFSAHTVRFNLEGTFNRVANMEIQTEDLGAGPVSVFVPGANTVIKESRGDFLLKDIWSMGKYEFDYGIGFEISKLTQSGDADVERNLSFLKPHAELSYTPNEIQKARFRAARDVAQLVFQEFISASLFRDDDVSLANPDLKPETTWQIEVGYERRFGRENVLKLTLFHHWISDVQDLIPITLTDESPGNIGNGRRWGIELESAVQMDWLGLKNSRLDINGRWQDSTVVDPVTSEDRVLTATILSASNSSRSIFDNDNAYVVEVDFRQDFEEEQVAWGWDMLLEADLKVFKVNELDVREKEPVIGLFVETTRWLGMKIRLEFNNILDKKVDRQRTFYAGQRGLSAVSRTQIQDRTDGREFGLSLSGSF